MKLSVISDTHLNHDKLGIMSGDVLIHCGDMFNMFNQRDDDFDRMDAWFGCQDFDLILCIGGNHDYELQKRVEYVEQPFKNAILLNDTGYEYQGIKFFGSPWVPQLVGHAFYACDRELMMQWSKIPGDTDVLITHTPPAGVLDVSSHGLQLGCSFLAENVRRVSPRLHCFGHVHESTGVLKKNKTTYINAAMANRELGFIKDPYTFSL